MTRSLCLAVWALLAASAVACELVARAGHRHRARLGQVLALAKGTPWRFSPVFLAWMWLGWHFFAR